MILKANVNGEFKKVAVPLKVIQQITVNGGGSFNAPAYVIEEAERVASGFNSKADDEMFKFVAISDMHEMGNNDHPTQSIIDTYRKANLEAGQGAKIVAEKVKPDCAVNFGDFAWGSADTTLYDGVWSITSARCKSYLDNVSENFYTVGNHDGLIYSTDGLEYDILTGMIGTYRYKDFDKKKIRVICLNTADNSVSKVKEYISGTQLQWFCNVLDLSAKSDASQWGIIVLSHHPLDWSTTLMPAANILAAYESGTSYSVTKDGVNVSYNFNGKNAAKVIANFHGHTHCFKVGDISGTSIKRIAIPNACFGRNNEYGRGGNLVHGEEKTYNKTDNSGKNTAFCVVGIDRQKGRIYADCYGAGYDRIIAIEGGEVITYSVTNSLSNAITDNGMNIVAEGGSYSATITANTGYTLEGATVSVKMGGKDITSTAYANGVITVAEVTGDITISVIAAVDESFVAKTYSITNSLSNVVNRNGLSEITEGDEYSATLEAANGYEMQSVTVTMGGKDITATAYAGALYSGNISIAKVTGNIVITAAAIKANYTNMVKLAESYDSTAVYNNGKGYVNGIYCSENEIANIVNAGKDSECVATGWIPFLRNTNNSLYIKGATLDTTKSHVRIYTYETKSYINKSGGYAYGSVISQYYTVEQLGDKYYKVTPKENTDRVCYVRLSLVGTGENLIVTINEPIE